MTLPQCVNFANIYLHFTIYFHYYPIYQNSNRYYGGNRCARRILSQYYALGSAMLHVSCHPDSWGVRPNGTHHYGVVLCDVSSQLIPVVRSYVVILHCQNAMLCAIFPWGPPTHVPQLGQWTASWEDKGGRRSPAVACWASDHWVASSNPLRGKFRH